MRPSTNFICLFMKNLITPSILLLLLAPRLSAQTAYPVAAIPPLLLKNADVVVRAYDLTFNVMGPGDATQTEYKVLTLLNENAAKYSEPVFHYWAFDKIEDMEASVYDADGKLVRHLKKKDIEDVKPPERFVDDIRYKVLRLPARSYPYTIEYTVTRRLNDLMFYPVFEPQGSPAESVERAHFEVKMPPGLEARFKEVNLPAGSKTGPMQWTFRNLAAFQPEPFAPANSLPLPKVLAAPTDFTFGGFAGDMRSWASFSAFQYQLLNTQRDLSAETKTALQSMVADCPDAPCKIRRVYAHLQANTRYFYVGLGIGGWQPAAASEVDRFKYGDCKGLSNYTVAMLQAVGVPAFYVNVRAGEAEQAQQFPDFPNAWFNHIIVCVPLEKDTLWLECTSQSESCGFLSNFTDNRPALLIAPEGGRLVQTPKYDERQNTTRRTTDIALAPDGSATLESKVVFQGISQDVPAALADRPDEVRKKYLYRVLNATDFEIKSIEFVRTKERLPNVEQYLSLALPRLASVSGKRLFLPIGLLYNKVEVPALDSVRRFAVQADSRGFSEEDDLRVSVPEGFRLEGAFAPVEISTAFGQFEMSVRQEPGGGIVVHRKLTLNSSVQPKERFGAFAAFLKAVAKADKTKLVLVKQT